VQSRLRRSGLGRLGRPLHRGRPVRDRGARGLEGHEELRALTEGLTEEYDRSFHLALNPVIAVEGDRAEADWYLNRYYKKSDGATGWRQGMYEDVYRKGKGT
jgi:hypothetical protein